MPLAAVCNVAFSPHIQRHGQSNHRLVRGLYLKIEEYHMTVKRLGYIGFDYSIRDAAPTNNRLLLSAPLSYISFVVTDMDENTARAQLAGIHHHAKTTGIAVPDALCAKLIDVLDDVRKGKRGLTPLAHCLAQCLRWETGDDHSILLVHSGSHYQRLSPRNDDGSPLSVDEAEAFFLEHTGVDCMTPLRMLR
jgi:hypothetical protein